MVVRRRGARVELRQRFLGTSYTGWRRVSGPGMAAALTPVNAARQGTPTMAEADGTRRARVPGGADGRCTGESEVDVGWEHFTHGADIGVRGSGASPGAAFEQAALALTAVIADPARVAPRAAFDFACAAPDLELLLADWLNALIYAMATRGVLFGRFEVQIDGGSLTAKAWGEPLDRERHQPAVEVKGATYTALSVARRDDGSWIAQCVVDV